MQTTAVIGLGVIGGSICAALTKAGCVVDGKDKEEKTVTRALQMGYIQAEAKDISAYDVVFLALPPSATIELLENERFKEGALVCDICGVKGAIEEVVRRKKRTYRYLGIHPMAGKETSGLESASSELFKGANLIVVRAQDTAESAMETVRAYAQKMGFGCIEECSAKEHDEKIALTSQLAHIVSNAYVKSPQVEGCEGFTGGSFQDMTRIAGVDEKVWTELYLYNRLPLLTELSGFIDRLCVYRDALQNEDKDALFEALKEGRLIRQSIKTKKD